MELISIFFILLSTFVLIYLSILFKSKKRVHLIFELFFVLIYLSVLTIFVYPNSLRLIEEIFGIQSAINFIIYLSIFVAYFIIFLLYNKLEEQRIEITKLNRELALLNMKKKK